MAILASLAWRWVVCVCVADMVLMMLVMCQGYLCHVKEYILVLFVCVVEVGCSSSELLFGSRAAVRKPSVVAVLANCYLK